MRLSIKDAAALCGRNERTLRAQLMRGEIPGKKENGRWMIERSAIPLTDAQRAAWDARAELIRGAVRDALPPGQSGDGKKRRRSALDFDALRAGKSIFDGLALRAEVPSATDVQKRALRYFDRGLLRLCEALYTFDLAAKIRQLRASRSLISRCIGCLVLAAPPTMPPIETIERIEVEILPAIGGLLRWSEKRIEKRS